MTVRGILCILLSGLLMIVALGTGIRELLMAALFLTAFWLFALSSLLLACATLDADGSLSHREIGRGDEVGYSITLRGRVILPIAGHIVTLPPGEHLPAAVPLRNAFFLRPSLLYWKRTFELTLRCNHRGRWAVAPHALLLQDIFGLFNLPLVRMNKRRPLPVELTVYPRVHDLRVPDQAVSSSEGFAAAVIRHATSGDLFGDTRQYQIGDPMRRIHWKLSARTGELQVRQFEAQENPRVLLVLDLGCRRADIENNADIATEIASSIGQYSVDRGRELQVLPVRARADGSFTEGNAGCRLSSARDFPNLMTLLCDVVYHQTDDELDAWQLRDMRFSHVGAVYVITDNPSKALLDDLSLLRRGGRRVTCFATTAEENLSADVRGGALPMPARPVCITSIATIGEEVGGHL